MYCCFRACGVYIVAGSMCWSKHLNSVSESKKKKSNLGSHGAFGGMPLDLSKLLLFASDTTLGTKL